MVLLAHMLRYSVVTLLGSPCSLSKGVHPSSWRDPKRLDIADVGNFRIHLGEIQASLKLIEEQASLINHLIAIGGDHTISLPLLRAIHAKRGPVALIHFDAHVDTWNDNFGQAYAHGSGFYHAINEGLVIPHKVVQIGIRSPVQQDTMDWTVGKVNLGLCMYELGWWFGHRYGGDCGFVVCCIIARLSF